MIIKATLHPHGVVFHHVPRGARQLAFRQHQTAVHTSPRAERPHAAGVMWKPAAVLPLNFQLPFR